MKTLPVRWSKAGRRDIERLIDHIAESSGSIAVAVGYTERIRARCDKIGLSPFAGVSRNDLRPGLRTVAFERSALICYAIIDDVVWITNVFSHGRDVGAAFPDVDPKSDES